MATGKVKTLYSDKEKSEALFPRTKTSAISDANGVGLDALMENILYSGTDNPEAAVAPLDADTLGGIPADDYATENFVAVKIAEAQMGGSGGDIDLSGYATKDDISNAVRAIDFPVDSVNGKTGTVQLSATDVGARPSNWAPTAEEVGAAPSSHNHSASDINSGILPVERGGLGQSTLTAFLQSMFPDTATPIYVPVFGSRWENRGYVPIATLMSAMGAAPSSHTHTKDQITNFPTSMPASDVYSWAKASSKPSYSVSEISGLTNFKTYYISGSGWLGTISSNWSKISDETAFIAYANISGARGVYWGFRLNGSYGTVLAIGYGGLEITQYRISGGTWTEKTW